MSVTAPSAWQLQAVISSAMQTLDTLRTEHGQIIGDDDILPSLAEEGIDLETVLTRLVRAALDAETMAQATEARITALRERKARFERAEQTCRNTMQAVMSTVELRRFQCADAGVTISDGRPKVHITDEAALPPEMVKTTLLVAPDKAAILAALKSGADVPGAVLSNGSATLTLRPR